MKAWTYRSASPVNPYWIGSGGKSLILVEYSPTLYEWRDVRTGILVKDSSSLEGHQGKLLAPEHWPQWYRNLQDLDMDEGL